MFSLHFFHVCRRPLQLLLSGLLTASAIALAGCSKAQSPEDTQAIQNGLVLARGIVEVHRQTAEYPRSLREVEPYLPPGTAWPLNPYNQLPVDDTLSLDFESGKSDGNIYYAKVVRDDQITNFSVVVFGRVGILKTWSQAELKIGPKPKGDPLGGG